MNFQQVKLEIFPAWNKKIDVADLGESGNL